MKAKTKTNSRFQELRKKHPTFIYESYKFDQTGEDLNIAFTFRIEPDIVFNPSVTLHQIPSHLTNLQDLEYIIFQLGLSEIPSYWKATCSPNIRITAGYLDNDQISFLSNLLKKGMTEFYYVNQINFTEKDLFNVTTVQKKIANNGYHQKLSDNKTLVPIGGGKDSLVSLKLIADSNKFQIGCLGVNPPPATAQVLQTAYCDQPITVSRKLDSKLLQLNSEGYLNGHTPFTAVLSFISVLVAAVYDYKYIAFSNEQSSNEGNTIAFGEEINHQYSKSFDYERLFHHYAKKYLLKNSYYFSFLRTLNEIEIAQVFSKYTEFHDKFVSCNKGQASKTWCGNCPKCLGTYLILNPYLSQSQLLQIFKSDFFANPQNERILLALAGLSETKPFECVPSFNEIKTSVNLSVQKLEQENLTVPPMLARIRKQLESKQVAIPAKSNQSKNLIPSDFLSLIKQNKDES